ncbi:MAG TPA: site-specific integrase [Bacillota bacterium]|nr:site-specific integrase [Bacillota bacterium]
MTGPHIPKYRRQRTRYGELAFVELNGKRHYLGPYDSPESKASYQRLLVEWTVGNRQPVASTNEITVVELIARYWRHVESYYRKPNGAPTSEVKNIQLTLRPLKELYGPTPAAKFGPLSLKAVREKMIEKGWCRKSVNQNIGRIKRMFRWATENELIPPTVFHGLQSVSGLRIGRSEAPESEPVKPVPEVSIAAVKPYVSRQVWALIQLQLHTAARSGELLKLRTIDIDISGKIWLYRPRDHKTAHHGNQRTIYLGPKAQDITKEFMSNRSIDAYLFSPREAEAERHAQAKVHRRPNQKPNPKKTQRVIGDHYTVVSYRRCIARACEIAKIPEWNPHQLRHSAATFIRKEFGLEAAQIMLGHSRADVTQIYAEVNEEKAVAIAQKIG